MSSGLGNLKRWWVGKYHLPATHALFQDQTLAELAQERYEDLFDEIATLEARLEKDAGGGDAGPTLERLRLLKEAVGEQAPNVQDDLIDLWEAELQAGRMPDLGLMPQDVKKG